MPATATPTAAGVSHAGRVLDLGGPNGSVADDREIDARSPSTAARGPTAAAASRPADRACDVRACRGLRAGIVRVPCVDAGRLRRAEERQEHDAEHVERREERDEHQQRERPDEAAGPARRRGSLPSTGTRRRAGCPPATACRRGRRSPSAASGARGRPCAAGRCCARRGSPRRRRGRAAP